MIIVYQTANANTPSIASASTVAASRATRNGWYIQNLGTNPLFVQLGTSASTSSFHFVLKGGSGNDDGNGASVSQTAGVVWTGTITVAGTTPRYTFLEH